MHGKPDSSQQGMALAIVMIMMACITIIALAFFMLFEKRTGLNTFYVHRYSAQYIAETGLNRYLWILNNDPYNVNNFIKQKGPNGNNTCTFTGYSQEGNGYYAVTCTNVPADPADNTTPASLDLTCTGWLANDPSNRYSFKATVTSRTFAEYLYVSEQEKDENGNPANNTVYWGPQDVLHGSLFTNDIIHTRDDSSLSANPHTPVFYGTVNCWDWGSSSSDYKDHITSYVLDNNITTWMSNEFKQGVSAPDYFPPKQAPQQYKPPTPNQIAALKAIAKAQGLYFNGRTSIWLDGTQLYVQNKDYPPGPNMGQRTPVTLSDNGVIYVDGGMDPVTDSKLPLNKSTASGDPYFDQPDPNDATNHYPVDYKFNRDLGNAFISGKLSGQLTVYAANNIYLTAGDPTSQYPTTPATSDIAIYQNTDFYDQNTNQYTPGTHVDNAVSTEYESASGTDMLGLIAYNYVMILRYGWPTNDDGTPAGDSGYHPAAPDYYHDYSPKTNTEIDAAIMAIKHSFLYEGYWYSTVAPNTDPAYPTPYPKLKIIGSIIQNNRGAVSGGDIYLLGVPGHPMVMGCGYLKDYWFDPRMTNVMPPYFLLPGNSGWGILTWSMITPPDYAILDTRIYVPAQSIAVSTVPGGVTSVAPGGMLQLAATVNPNNEDQMAPQTVIWSFSDGKTTDTTTGSRIDPYTGILTAGTAGTIKVKATANGSTVTSDNVTISITS